MFIIWLIDLLWMVHPNNKRRKKSSTIRIPLGLKEGIEKFLETEDAHVRGFRYNQDIVNEAVRKLLEYYGVIPEYLYSEDNGE